MIDHGIEFPAFRLHVVPAVLALASPSWQRDVWLQSGELEDLDYVINVLFDDFCNADDPAPWLGKSLRTEEEVTLMKELGRAYSAVQESVGRSAPDEAYLDASGWGIVITIAARLAQVMVINDLQAAALLEEQRQRS
ncbi:SCO4402 family protein [Streptomyces sp. NPDC003710]